MIYTKGLTLQASLLNSLSQLSIIGAFQLIEDNVTELMGNLNIDGLTTMNKYNAMWVFSKNKVQFVKPISWNDNMSVESFVSTKSLAKFTIDTYIRDQSGDIAVASRAEICGLDAATMRIRKIAELNVGDNIDVYEPQVDIQYTRFDNELGGLVDSRLVKATNIDYLHHCNNIEYIRFILDTYTDKYVVNSIAAIEVVYAGQCFEGQELQIYKNDMQSKDCVYIVRDGTIATKCEIIKR